MILLLEEMLAEIEDYCRTEPDIVFRTEAIRRLIRAGLDAVKGGATGLPGNRPNSARAYARRYKVRAGRRLCPTRPDLP